jgi:predicted ATP-grasp superfamily ATP-dependent carboligase
MGSHVASHSGAGTGVLVLDGEARAALAAVRSLGRAGYQVHVGATSPLSLAGGSRFASSETVLPDPLLEGATYVQRVLTLAAERQVRVLLPATEASTIALLEHAELLTHLLVPTSDLAHFRNACDKAAVLDLARSLGIDVPEQWSVPGLPEDLPVLPQEVFPLVVKPSRSVVGPEGRRRKVGVSYADSPGHLRRLIADQGAEAGPYLLQSRIDGPGLGIFLLRWHGRTVAAFSHRRLREKPPSGGVSVLCESVVADPEVLARSEALLAALDWSGVAMVEYKQDHRTGRNYLMEVNPRLWGSLQLAIDAGVDFPRLLVQAALGEPVVPVTRWAVGVRSRWGWGDIDHLLLRLVKSKSALALPPSAPGLLPTALSVLLPWRPRQRSDVLRLTDLNPWWRETRSWFRALTH